MKLPNTKGGQKRDPGRDIGPFISVNDKGETTLSRRGSCPTDGGGSQEDVRFTSVPHLSQY